jgi:formylglycine-generating enzyme required for sulfatase activity
MKLFISYARVDKPLCKQIVERLSDVHEVWYDKRLHAGQEWWEEIQERLEWCEGFAYLLSPESVASEYCQKEFALAANAGKHLFPVLIQARTSIPDALSHIHYADLSNGMEDMITLMNALTIAERQQRKPVTPKLITPPSESAPKTSSPNQALADTADAMDAKDFDKAVFILKQALTQKPEGRTLRLLENLLKEAETALEEKAYLREAEREYAPILELTKRASTRAMACEEFAAFQRDFPDYDPENIATICQQLSSTTQHQIKTPPATKTRPSSLNLMPKPFAWIEIPQKGYSMAKYPVTNAQFAEFIKAGGYENRDWWTEEGWEQRRQNRWTEPRYWKDSKWNGTEQPVVGVSWYEAIAFCLWLSETTGEKIMLPTAEQWQYAAQGDDGRDYPWGKQWDVSHCNNNADGKGIGKTSPVRQYEGKGDSPFGLVDMAGNVWEWCLTDHDKKTNDFDSNATHRVMRGGCWYNTSTYTFHFNFQHNDTPDSWSLYFGFRLCRSK